MDQVWTPQSKSGSAYDQLRTLIVQGSVRPDRRLSPTDLAAVFRISVTPVRDALARLDAEGYVRGEAGRGYFSKRFAVEEQRDLMRVLLMSLVTIVDAQAAASPGMVRDAFATFAAEAAEVAKGPEGGAAFVVAQDRLFLDLSSNSASAIIPHLIRNALDRTQYVRRLDGGHAARREAIGLRLAELAEAALRRDIAAAVLAGRQIGAELAPTLPDLVREANVRIAANKFP
jgi:DNA-binding GntR family transcriptional regulator